MKKKYAKLSLSLFFLLFIIFISPACKKLDDLEEAIDEKFEEALGIKALSEELDKTSSNFNNIENIIINGLYVSGTEIRMEFPSSVPYSFTKKRYSLSGSSWTTITSSYSGTFPKSLLTNKSNTFKVIVQNNVPKLAINDVAASSPTTSTVTNPTPTPGTGTTTTTLADQVVEGKSYELKTFSFTLPSGVKSMTIRTTESATGYMNTADLFVRKNLAPEVRGPKPPTYLPYTYTADCHGVLPNREDESCTFTSPTGLYYVSLYGYNTNFASRLIITITR